MSGIRKALILSLWSMSAMAMASEHRETDGKPLFLDLAGVSAAITSASVLQQPVAEVEVALEGFSACDAAVAVRRAARLHAPDEVETAGLSSSFVQYLSIFACGGPDPPAFCALDGDGGSSRLLGPFQDCVVGRLRFLAVARAGETTTVAVSRGGGVYPSAAVSPLAADPAFFLPALVDRGGTNLMVG